MKYAFFFRACVLLILLCLPFLLPGTLKGQTIQGYVSEPGGKPVPYATVFIPQLSLGAAANEEGYFLVHLLPGNYSAVFQSMGYKPTSRQFSLQKDTVELNVVLSPMVYELKAVVIKGGKEDPAYAIMRKVIRKAPLYATMVRLYDANVYIKGSLFIERISGAVKLLATEDLKEARITEGSTYFEESVNEVSFTAPDHVKQKVKSIQSTFPFNQESRSSSALGFISGNIYKPQAFGRAISPFSAGAFNYYRFKYLGSTQQNGNTVARIQVIPRGKGAQYLSGFLYIVEDLWCIYALDVSINEQLGVELHLKQQYAEVNSAVWLPVSNEYDVSMDLLGNKGSFQYHTTIRYINLKVNLPDFVKEQLNEPVVKTQAASANQLRQEKISRKLQQLNLIEEPNTAQSYKASRLLARRERLRLRDSLIGDHNYVERYTLSFDSIARNQDSSFWNQIRPIPLTEAEVKGLATHDSLLFIRGFENAPGSTEQEHKPLWKIMLTGGMYYRDSLTYLKTKGIFNPPGLSYNVVDGFAYRSVFSWVRRIPNHSVLALSVCPGYAFSRDTIQWQAALSLKSEKKLKSSYSFSAGELSKSFNEYTVSTLPNTLYSLFLRKNLLKLYEKKYLRFAYEIRPYYGFKMNSSLAWEYNYALENHSDFSFFYKKEREFEPNIPENRLFSMQNHQNLKMKLMLTYQPMPFYYFKDGEKVPRPRMNQTPLLYLGWEKAFRFNRFHARYDHLIAGIRQRFKFGYMSTLSYVAEMGTFLKSNKIYFNDFKHFTVQESFLGTANFYPVFQLCEYYKYSTNTTYAEAHLAYESPFLALKYLPIIRNRLMSEKLYFNYNYTTAYHHYYEFGYGLGNPIFELGLFAGFNNDSFQSLGVKLALVILSSANATPDKQLD